MIDEASTSPLKIYKDSHFELKNVGQVNKILKDKFNLFQNSINKKNFMR